MEPHHQIVLNTYRDGLCVPKSAAWSMATSASVVVVEPASNIKEQHSPEVSEAMIQLPA
jgi:hypothetical protein